MSPWLRAVVGELNSSLKNLRCGEEVPAVWRAGSGEVAAHDLLDVFPAPRLALEVGEDLVLVGRIFDGVDVDEELIEIVLIGDLLQYVQDGRFEVLLILLLPLGEVEEVTGVGRSWTCLGKALSASVGHEVLCWAL